MVRVNRIIASSVLSSFLLILMTAGVVLAHEDSQTANLNQAGLTPDSPFYFLDQIGEAIKYFFTFNPEAKARLQIEFAAERVAEVKIMLEKKDVKPRGLDVARSRLQAHLAKAAGVLENEKTKGEDVSAIAKNLKDQWKSSRHDLKEAFDKKEKEFDARKDVLKAELRAALAEGNSAKASELAKEISALKEQEELLDIQKDALKDELEDEEDMLEEQLEDAEEAREKISKAEEERDELLEEAAEEGISLPADVFNQFNAILSRAKNALAANDAETAKQLAKQAKESLETVDKLVDHLEEQKEKEEEAEEERLEKEAERLEKEREAEEEARERDEEEAEKAAEKIKDKKEAAEKKLKIKENERENDEKD